MSRMTNYMTNLDGDGFWNWFYGTESVYAWNEPIITWSMGNYLYDWNNDPNLTRQAVNHLDSILQGVTFQETSGSASMIDLVSNPLVEGGHTTMQAYGGKFDNDLGIECTALTSGIISLSEDADLNNSYWHMALIHELGHIMGLGHPGPYNGTPNIIYPEDNDGNTVMSYNWGPAPYPTSYQEFDKKAFYLLGYDVDCVDVELSRNFSGVHKYWADDPYTGNEGLIHIDAGDDDVFVFDNLSTGGTFMTADDNEAQAVMNMSGFELVDAFQYDPNGDNAVHRFFNHNNGSHFYTDDDGEAQAVMGFQGFSYEGIEFYG